MKLFDQNVYYKFVESQGKVTVSNLYPNRMYKANFIFLNSMAEKSKTISKSFKTLENGG